jgi:predicted MFS family arabinose efflux permease
LPPSEKKIILLIAAIQFVNILEFMIVLPMGPDFARDLSIPLSDLGFIGGSYTFAASLAGFIGSLILDRYNRQKAMIVALTGLTISTIAAGFATSYPIMIFARLMAGLCGGPAASLSLAVVADLVPPERRGRAMGIVFASFSVASIIGVPASLEIATIASWRWSFFAISILALIAIFMTIKWLPSFKPEFTRQSLSAEMRTSGKLLLNPDVALAMVMMSAMMIALFMIIPNIASFILYNLDYPREHLGRLYLAGGVFSFIGMTQIGKLVDKKGSASIATVATIFFSGTLLIGFGLEKPIMPVMLIFILFMSCSSIRGVSYNTLSSKVPPASQRGRFMSMQSAVQHMASAFGAFVAAKMLTVNEDQSLSGMYQVSLVAFCLSLTLPPLIYLLESRVKRRIKPQGLS